MSPRSEVVLRDPGGITVHRSQIPSGPLVYTESIPAVHSVSLGVWVPIGSRHETPAAAGATHFLEHLLFKGTKRRTPLEIAASLERVGGEINAFTTKEFTCYHARFLDEHLDVAVDVLADMLGDSLLRTADIDAERAVVVEEIAMSEDDPVDVARTRLEELMFAGHALGRPVAGTSEGILSMRSQVLRGHYRRYYQPDNYIVTAVGSASHRAVVRLVEKAFGVSQGPVRQPKPGIAPRPLAADAEHVARPLEQTNLVLGYRSLARNDTRRYAQAVLHALLGAGMSSRLFQEVRERRSLAYSVTSFRAGYSDTGMFGIYAGCAPDKVAETRAVIHNVLNELIAAGLSDDEVRAAKEQVKGQTVLDLEDPGARLMRLGTRAIFGEPLIAVGDVLKLIDAVTASDVIDLAEQIFSGPEVEVLVGPKE